LEVGKTELFPKKYWPWEIHPYYHKAIAHNQIVKQFMFVGKLFQEKKFLS